MTYGGDGWLVASDAQPVCYLVMVTGCVSVGKIGESEIFRISSVAFVSMHGSQLPEEERVAELKKLLGSGKFFRFWTRYDQETVLLPHSMAEKARFVYYNS